MDARCSAMVEDEAVPRSQEASPGLTDVRSFLVNTLVSGRIKLYYSFNLISGREVPLNILR